VCVDCITSWLATLTNIGLWVGWVLGRVVWVEK
jgi:hypothetical protein